MSCIRGDLRSIPGSVTSLLSGCVFCVLCVDIVSLFFCVLESVYQAVVIVVRLLFSTAWICIEGATIKYKVRYWCTCQSKIWRRERSQECKGRYQYIAVFGFNMSLYGRSSVPIPAESVYPFICLLLFGTNLCQKLPTGFYHLFIYGARAGSNFSDTQFLSPVFLKAVVFWAPVFWAHGSVPVCRISSMGRSL